MVQKAELARQAVEDGSIVMEAGAGENVNITRQGDLQLYTQVSAGITMIVVTALPTLTTIEYAHLLGQWMHCY